jgi:E3 ubiquitin-protein ligase UBR4
VIDLLLQTEAEQEIVDVVRHFEARLLDINEQETPQMPVRSENTTSAPIDNKRRTMFLQSCLQVLMEEYSPLTNNVKKYGLSSNSEQLLLQRICEVIQPPKNPVNVKIFMRRAPTQEEFFRGTLSRNPVQLSQLSCPQEEPTVKHLRQYIADQLQMSDTAELIELLCANKILNLDLKLRVVQQVLWKNYLVENSSAGGIGTQMFFSTGSGISMVFSSERPDRRTNITADTPSSALPPMVVTYRLAGVDGEATEDLLESLIDPEAPMIGNLTSDEQERFLEKEFGQTKEVMHGQGVNILLRSIQSYIKGTLSRIRRDDVLFNYVGHGKRSEKNFSLANFEKSPPYSGLVLLKLCTKLASNCKKLVNARAPTILLRLLLEVFNTIDDTSLSDSNDPTSDQNAQIVSNPTALMLEDLIETLASDISSDDNREEDVTEIDQSSSTLPLLLSSLKTIYLGPQLRKVIAKLLPFLTYGMSSLAKELAENFDLHIKVEKLCDCDAKEQPKTRRFVLMDTFVQAAVSLPPSGVCHSLRAELIKCGLVERLVSFILHGIPEEPPPWSFSLWLKEINKATSGELEQSWKYYFLRTGIKTAMEMLVGLARGHGGVQSLLATYLEGRFMMICHWIESTSDKKSSRIYLNGLGLLAETLLDEMKADNPEITKSINSLRRKTRERKREIAEERRSKAMVSITSFGPSVSAGINRSRPGMSDTIRSSASSFLAPVLDFFSSNSESLGVKALEQPAWMAEMEALEDETGLTCAVCQEGRTLQPKELLGLYCYVKKVSIPPNKCRGKLAIEGSLLLINLPSSLPTSLVGTTIELYCFLPAKSIGESLRKINPSWYNTMINATNRRATQITTTVSAGNAIHYSCHAKARSADRSHPKAPKSEWEGASLRNSRVNCNAIMPLVSSQSSKVPLVAVESALNDYQTIITNQLGARPKAILWTVLNDVRLLLLRIAYGEALSADCGGGSLSSNISLLFYQLLLVDMFTNDASHDSPQTARHAQHLSGGFLAACKIVQAENLDSNNYSSLIDDIADAAPMAALSCISYHNTKDENLEHPEKDAKVPHPNCRWNVHKDVFFFGLIICAGRRHILGADDSGCRSNRKSRPRQSSFSDWEAIEMRRSDGEVSDSTEKQKSSLRPMSKTNVLRIDDYATALRPMIILYALFDALSAVYVPNMTDEMIQYSTAEIVKHVEVCHQAKGIHDLVRKAKIVIENDSIVEYLQLGMHSS